MGSRHSSAELVRFFDRAGDHAQVVARDIRTGHIFYLPTGTADQHRAITRSYLRCPLPTCDGELTTVGGTRRDHFRHLTGGGHPGATETLFHLAGKYVVAAWARQQLGLGQAEAECSAPDEPGSTVRPAHHDSSARAVDVEVPLREVTRVADVLVSHADGARSAFEIEYFHTQTPEQFDARRADYATAGVNDTWLFGHTSLHMRAAHGGSEAGPDEVAITPICARIAASGRPVLILNPIDRTVGTLVRVGPDLDTRGWGWWDRLDAFGLSFPTQHDRVALVRIDPLDDCTLDSEHGIVTPAMRAVWGARARLAEQAEAGKALAFARAAAKQAREAKDRGTREARKQFAKEQRAQRERAWRDHPYRADLIKRHGRPLPTAIAAQLDSDGGVFAVPEHWHARVFESLILDQPLGATFTVADVYRTLRERGIGMHSNPSRLSEAVVGYLKLLRDTGHVAFTLDDPGSDWISGPITIRNNQPKPTPRPARPEGSGWLPEPPAVPPRVDVQPAAPAARSALDRLPDWDSRIGRVRNYLPGIGPVRLWHVAALEYLQQQGRDVTIDGLRSALAMTAHQVRDATLSEVLAAWLDPARLR